MSLPYTFIGHRAFDGISFAAALGHKISTILCCDGAGTASLAQKEFGLTLHSIETAFPAREHWTSRHMDRLAETLWGALSDEIRQHPVIAYAPSQAMEMLKASGKVLDYIANPARLMRFFDNKSVSARLFRHLRLPAPQSRTIKCTRSGLSKVVNELGLPLVARRRFSSTGSGTFLLDDRPDMYEYLTANGIALNEVIILERFVEGIPVNINAVIIGEHTFIYEPSIQLVGIAGCTSLPFGFCGNDYISAQELSPDAILECKQQVRMVASHLRKAGYRGLFGMDLIIASSGAIVPCEINPRMQNSTSLLNWAYKDSPLSPALLHLAAYGRNEVTPATLRLQLEPPQFAQLIVQAGDEDDGGLVMQSLEEGIYRTDANGRLHFRAHTLSPLRLQEDDFLLCGSPPQSGTHVSRYTGMFRLITRQPVSDDGFVLQSQALHEVAQALKNHLHVSLAESVR